MDEKWSMRNVKCAFCTSICKVAGPVSKTYVCYKCRQEISKAAPKTTVIAKIIFTYVDSGAFTVI